MAHLLTLWCSVIVVMAPFAIGLPLVWVLNGRRALEEDDYLRAPFLGVALVVLAGQNVVTLNGSLRAFTLLFWVLTAALWAGLLWRGQWRDVLRRCGIAAVALAAGVYALAGLPMLLVGAPYYYGRGWTDQYNYTATAQFLLDHPYNTTLQDLSLQPYLSVIVQFLKADRIGQSVLHGFFAASAFTDAQTAFEPTILLGPVLIALAVWALAGGLGLPRRLYIVAGAVSALLPGITMMHLEGFLSQALSTGFLLLTLPASARLAAMLVPITLGIHAGKATRDQVSAVPQRRTLLLRTFELGLLLGALALIYPEFLILGVACVVLVLGIACAPVGRLLPAGGIALASVVIGLLVSPSSFPNTLKVLQRTSNVGSVLLHVYPWAFDVEGLARLWLGDGLPLVSRYGFDPLRRLCGFGLTVLGYFGLFNVVLESIDGRRDGRASIAMPQVALGVAALALACVPWLIVVRGGQEGYQFYKLLLSTAPLLVIGLFALLFRVGRGLAQPNPSGRWAAPARWTLALAPIGVLIVCAGGSLAMVLGTLRDPPGPRAPGHFLTQPAVRELQDYLRGLRDHDVLIAESNGYLSSWLMYFARHNRVWVSNPWIVDGDLSATPAMAPSLALEQMPVGTLVVLGPERWLRSWPAGDSRLVWSNDSFQVWSLGEHGWALPLLLENRNGIESQREPLFWLGGDTTTVTVLTPSNGVLGLSGRVGAGPSAAPGTVPRLKLEAGPGFQAEVEPKAEEFALEVPVTKGVNRLRVTPLTQAVAVQPAGDARPLLMGVRDLRLSFVPADVR